jgi:hypothetical protein
MRLIAAGILAGLIATAVLSIVIVLKAALGIVPELSMIATLSEASARVLGTPRNLVVGWIEHLLIGTVLWGTVFGLTNPLWRQRHVIRGIIFAVLAWLLMMVFLLPLAGLGVFGTALGPVAVLTALILHLVYGLVLGYYFGRLMTPVRAVRREQTETIPDSPQDAQRRRPAHQR